MHNLKSIVLLIAITVISSCQKDKDGYWGTISVQKNGASWVADIQASKSNVSDSKCNIIITTSDEKGVPLESLVFYSIPKAIGRYHLSDQYSQLANDTLVWSYYANGYDDQLFDSYLLSPQDSTSYIEITDYNSKKKEILGKFNLVVWPDIKGSWNAPDSIVFADGVFHTKILD